MPGDMASSDLSTLVFGVVVLLAGLWCFVSGMYHD